MAAVNRTQFYLSRGTVTRYLDKKVTTYPGAPTIPNSATGNNVVYGGGNGVGAKLLPGVGPVIVPPLSCNEILISSVGPPTSFNAGDGETVVPISYNEPLESDIYVVFQLGTGIQIPVVDAEIVGASDVELTLDLISSLGGGAYALKIIRASDPKNCFTIRYNAFDVTAAAVCTLTITDMTGDGIFPSAPLSPGDLDNVISVTGTGFLDGTLTATIFQVFGDPPGTDLPIDLINVIDDNNLTIQFDTFGDSDGSYGLTLSVNEIPGCEATIGTEFGEPQINVVLF